MTSKPKKLLIGILLFIAMMIPMVIGNTIIHGLYPLPPGVAIAVAYILTGLVTYFGLTRFENSMGVRAVLVPIILSALVANVPEVIISSIGSALMYSPFYISTALGIVTGYLLFKGIGKWSIIAIAIFPLVMALGGAGKTDSTN